MTTQFLFKTSGMNCGSCIRAITGAIQEKDSSAKVEISLAEQTINVLSNLSKEALVEIIQEEGYSIQN